MDKYERSKVDKLISELDGASGRMIVAAMRDNTVKEAMEMITKVSIELGNMIDQE
jgi:hypothetical protein